MPLISNRLQAFDFFLLRAPLLPVNALSEVHEKHDADYVKAFFSDPLLQEAIYLASPELFATLRQWMSGTLSLKPAKEQKLILALYRYMLRMSTRSTPYGLFAGCARGTITDGPSSIRLGGPGSLRKVTRLDMHYLSELAGFLVRDPALGECLQYFPNTSLYRSGNSYRYYEYQLKDQKRNYFLSSFTRTPYLDQLFRAARTGATIRELTKVFTVQDIEEEEAGQFIATLIRSQVLVSSLHPSVAGEDYFGALIKEIRRCPGGAGLAQQLEKAGALLEESGDGTDRYERIGHTLRELYPSVSSPNIVQLDLFFNTEANNLSTGAVDTITGLLESLIALHQSAIPEAMQNFCRLYAQRYEEREMPLMTVLDSENGIGYGVMTGEKSSYTPLVDDLVIPGNEVPGQTVWNPLTKLVFDKYIEAQRGQARVIELTDADLAGLPKDHGSILSSTIGVLGTLLAEGPEQLDQGRFQFILKSCSGPAAATLMGRFAAGDPQLAEKLKACALYDKQALEGRIIAEIIHLPEGRTGNILIRPQLYSYEIPFLGSSQAEKELQIPLDDLYVSVRQDKIVLRSKSLGKEIIPRLTSAHNFSMGLSVYRFLCDMQFQHKPLHINWDWKFLNSRPFLPRVTYRQIILKRARWFLQEAVEVDGDENEDLVLDRLITAYGLPTRVIIAEGDNELFLDLSFEYARKIFLDKVQKGNVVAFECLETEGRPLVAGEKGPHCNEVLLPLYHRGGVHFPPEPRVVHLPVAGNVRRSFPPGSEWLYAKIYCGTTWIEKLLVNEVRILTEELLVQDMVKKWFYIRYQDPGSHLRIRFHHPGDPAFYHHVCDRINKLFGNYVEEDIIHKVQYDTYVREIERYGEDAILLSEDYFYHDSEAVLGLFALLQSKEKEDSRWQFALKGVDCMLSDFGFGPAEKLQLIQRLQSGFFSEFNGNTSLLGQLNQKYRDNTMVISKIISSPPELSPLPAEVLDIFRKRSVAGQQVHAAVTQLYRGAGAQRLWSLVPDYIHMFMNRMFVANQRMHELVIYHYLSKYYSSSIARDKIQPAGNSTL
jgi:thiopeptide-type bacteriocin biosynthesis protein